jgi:hypothetical protein
MRSSDGWLPTTDLGNGTTPWSSLAAGVPKDQTKIGFEVWDTNRFFRLYAWTPERQGVRE